MAYTRIGGAPWILPGKTCGLGLGRDDGHGVDPKAEAEGCWKTRRAMIRWSEVCCLKTKKNHEKTQLFRIFPEIDETNQRFFGEDEHHLKG